MPIVIRVQLVNPRHNLKSEIGYMLIGNDSTGTDDLGNYTVEMSPREESRFVKHGRVVGHPRRDTSVWLLVRKAIDAVMPQPASKEPT